MSDNAGDEQRQLTSPTASIDILMMRVDKTSDDATRVTLADKNTSDMDLDNSEQKAITQDILSINVCYAAGDKIHRGVMKKVSGDRDSCYGIYKMADGQLLVNKIYSDSMDKLENSLINGVVYIMIIIADFFSIIMMMWVSTLIHPLDQMRNYIECIKLDGSAGPRVDRRDEIDELTDALISMQEKLYKQEKAKGKMIHNIPHDLKTPVAAIKSYNGNIKDGVYPYDTLEKSADIIIENADRLEQKIHSLLFMNHMEYLISQDYEGIGPNMEKIVETAMQNTRFIYSDIQIPANLKEIYFDGLTEPWHVIMKSITENALWYVRAMIDIYLSEEESLTVSSDRPCMDEDHLKVLSKPRGMGKSEKFGPGLSIVARVVNANGYEVVGENMVEEVISRIYRPKNPAKKRRQKHSDAMCFSFHTWKNWRMSVMISKFLLS